MVEAAAAPQLPDGAVVLAATDPANPWGAALRWPERDAGGHQPGRKAGALVVAVDGRLVLYVERGGRTLLSWPSDDETLEAAARGLADAVQRGEVLLQLLDLGPQDVLAAAQDAQHPRSRSRRAPPRAGAATGAPPRRDSWR